MGIYPRCLNITVEQSSKDSVTHQDLRIRRYIDNPTGTAGGGPTYRYRTETYDKKDDAQYDRIRDHIVYYCHPDTMLPDSCIYGVVYSQAQRYAKRNSTLEDFRVAVLRMVGRMASMGYVHRKINKQFGKFASRYTGRYGSNGVKKVAGLVVAALQAVQPTP